MSCLEKRAAGTTRQEVREETAVCEAASFDLMPRSVDVFVFSFPRDPRKNQTSMLYWYARGTNI